MLSSTRLRYLEYFQGACLGFGILISGLFGCTSISAPKISPGSASAGSSGTAPLGGGAAGRDGGGGGATDGMKDAKGVADGPSSGGNGGGGSGSGGSGSGGAGGMVPDAAIDAPTLIPDGFLPAIQGATCSANSDCASNVCSDGFCCDKTCTGCNACDQTLTGQPSGTCAPVTSGKNAHSFCKDETTTKKGTTAPATVPGLAAMRAPASSALTPRATGAFSPPSRPATEKARAWPSRHKTARLSYVPRRGVRRPV